MQIQFITGDGRDESANTLRHLKELQDWIGESAKTVYAESYDAAGLVEIIEVRAANEKEILVLGCSREQIQAVLEWQSAIDEAIELNDVLLHLIRHTNSNRGVTATS